MERSFVYHSDEIEIRLPFYRSFTLFWNIFDGLCTQDFYSSAWEIRGDLKLSFVS